MAIQRACCYTQFFFFKVFWLWLEIRIYKKMFPEYILKSQAKLHFQILLNFFNWRLIVGWLQHCLELFFHFCVKHLWSSLSLSECTSSLRVTPAFMSFSVSSKCIVYLSDFSSPYCQNHSFSFTWYFSWQQENVLTIIFASKYTSKCCAKEIH